MYREVTMIEVREVLRLARRGPAEEADRRPARARSEDGAPVSRRPRTAAGVRVTATDQRRGGPRGPARAASGRRAAARRRLGALCRAARGDRALARRRPPADEDSQAARAAGRRRSRIRRSTASRSSSCSLARRRRRSRCSMASPARSCRSIRAGSAGSRCRRARSGGFARGSSPPCARGTASSIRPSRKRRRGRSRRVKRRGSFSAASSRSSFRITPRRSSSTADPLAPRITPAFLEYAQARHFHIDAGARAACPRQRARRARRARRPRRLLRRRSAHHARRRARAAAGTGASTTTACGATVARSADRSSTFRPRSRRVLLPAPTTPYDIPLWSEPKVGARSARRGRQGALLDAAPVRRAAASPRAPTRRSSASTPAAS